MVIEKAVEPIALKNPLHVDIIIISKAPKLAIREIHKNFRCHQIVIDASNPFWKVSKWKVECDSLNIPCHVVSENGAFVMSMN